MSDRTLDLNDIQGNILGGFNTDVQELIALTVSETESFGSTANWLASISDEVTVVSEVKSYRKQMKQSAASDPLTWLFVAIGSRFLQAVAPDVRILDAAFNSGMLKRAASFLGDKTDPATWKAGNTNFPVDVFLIVASNDESALSTRAAKLISDAEAVGLNLSWRETGRRLDDREHFGFRDGISQPRVIGYDHDGTIGAGFFIFGYPKSPGEAPFSPTKDDRGVTDNGSLLVWRRLLQDVQAFRTFCTNAATTAAEQWPNLANDHLAALLVGRWQSGSPLKFGVTKDPVAIPPNNSFDFTDDPDAKSCPFGAHIRKVNPREGKKDVVNIPRLLRRGIPFGRLYDDAPAETNRGLAFLAFQSSIKDQFEFLTQHWMNSDQNPARGHHDVLIGRTDGVRSLTIIGPNGPLTISASRTQNWIIPTGGAYLFAPSRSGLKKLATPPPAFGFWRAKQLMFRAVDRIKSLLPE